MVNLEIKNLLARLVQYLYRDGYIGVYPTVPLDVLRRYFTESELSKLLKWLEERGLVEYWEHGQVMFKFKIVTPNILFQDEVPRPPVSVENNVEIEFSKPFTTHDIDINIRKLDTDTVQYLKTLYDYVCSRGLLGLHVCYVRDGKLVECRFAYCDWVIEAEKRFGSKIPNFEEAISELRQVVEKYREKLV